MTDILVLDAAYGAIAFLVPAVGLEIFRNRVLQKSPDSTTRALITGGFFGAVLAFLISYIYFGFMRPR